MFDLFLAAFVCTWGIMCAVASALVLTELYLTGFEKWQLYQYRVRQALELCVRAKSGNVSAAITFCNLVWPVRLGARFAYWYLYDRSPEGIGDR